MCETTWAALCRACATCSWRVTVFPNCFKGKAATSPIAYTPCSLLCKLPSTYNATEIKGLASQVCIGLLVQVQFIDN